ncbi:MAG: thioredoxin family protein [Alistipes sp.]|nr:thioredoxin family protein [Alistipes sp.]
MKNFDQQIWQEKLTLVEFYATWCSPCRQMEPIIAQFAERMHHRTDVLRIDIEDAHLQHIIHRYHIVSVPTLMFFRRGEVMWRESGCVGYNHLVTVLEELEQYELAEARY